MNDTKKIQATISNLIGNSLIDLLVILASLTAIFYYAYTVGLIFLFFVPVYFLIVNSINRSILSLQHISMSAYAVNEGNYIDTITGIESIKSNLAGLYFNKQANYYYSNYQDSLFNLGRLQIKFQVITNTLNVIIFVSLIGLSSNLVISNQLLPGALVAILSLSNYIFPSLSNLSSFYIQFQEARVAFIRMNEFTSIETEDSPGREPVPSTSSNLTLENVCFNYSGSTDLLNHVDLSLTVGKIKILSGKNGSGKSTIVHLITKSLTPSAGKICLDGIDINLFSLDEYRKLIGVVPQDIKIFNNTLLFNLTLTDDPQINKEAFKWCNQHGFDLYFNKFPSGYQTIVGEDGLKLSGGQKQMLALARALLRAPRYLILDEITSSIDAEAEEFIMNLLLKLKADTGILIISHHPKIFLIADEIYELTRCKIEKK
jgi:ATP-binding cassette subfamily B protein